MLIKHCWSEMIFELKWAKENRYGSKTVIFENKVLELYLEFVLLIVFTPFIIIIDLLLSPFEVSYYFFKKALS